MNSISLVRADNRQLLLSGRSRWLKILLSFFLIIIWASPVQAQEPVIRFGRISLEQGLSHGTVYSIVQDQTGFMWFGTPSGLNKYDGYNITVYHHDPDNPRSISNDNAGNLFIDSSGIIWIGTWGGGLNRFDPRTEEVTPYLHDPDDPHSLSNDRVQTIFEDSSGMLWVGTADGGLNKLDPQTGQFTHYQHDPNDPHSLSNDRIWRIVEDNNGMLWIATSDGLNQFDPQTEIFTIYKNDPANPYSLSHSLVRTVYLDRAGTLWVGTENGLNKFDPPTKTFTRYLNNPLDHHSLSDNIINAILEDSAGNFWVGVSRGGLNQFDRQTETFTRHMNDPYVSTSLSYNDVRWILEDRSGVIWVATRGGGVNKFTPTSKSFGYIASDPNNPHSLSNNDVRAIYKDQAGIVWIGTKGGGLNKYDPRNGVFTHFQHDPADPTSLSHNDVYAIYEDPSGALWLGTSGGGLNKFDPLTGSVLARYQHDLADPASLSSDDVNLIYPGESGNLWLGTKGGGLNLFDPQTETFTRYQHDPHNPASLGNNDVYDIHQDSSGAFWVATYGGGLNKFDPQTGQFTRYQNNPAAPASLSSDDVYTIYEDSSGALWIGTANGGLNKFDPKTEKFAHFTQADGLYSDVVYGILGDESDNLWLSTSKGLSKFDPRSNTFINYDASDGLESVVYNEDAYHRSYDGAMFFGGINGLVQFYPEQIKDNPHPPPVALTALTRPGKEMLLSRVLSQLAEIELSYADDTFTFEFAALDYTNPAKNQYAYMLEGFDTDWIEAGPRRFATYTNLDPGTYTFRVKAANNAGIWNEDGVSIRLTVTPPFWETWWFRVLAGLVLLGLALAAYKLRTRSIKAQSKRLKVLVDERTAELSEANRHLRTLTGRLQHELTMARSIQLNLLPPARPECCGLDVICYSTPAREVGGDFYAYHAFNNPSHNHFSVAVGDVSGKGMPAALLMAVGIASFQSSVGQGLPPAKLLAQLDDTLIPYTRTGLENCALCYVDIQDYTLRVANAGCITPIIRRASGSVEWVDIGGMPLGVGLGAQDGYAETTLTLTPGDLIVLTSDGVVEAMTAAREIFGFERLEHAIATGPQVSAEAMLSHVREAVLAFLSGVEPQDDLTIVVVQV